MTVQTVQHLFEHRLAGFRLSDREAAAALCLLDTKPPLLFTVAPQFSARASDKQMAVAKREKRICQRRSALSATCKLGNNADHTHLMRSTPTPTPLDSVVE